MMKMEILIAGGGFAGAYCARTLARELGSRSIERVGLISEQNILVFQPMLAEVAAATLLPVDVVNPLRQFCKGVNVLRGEIVEIDLDRRRVILDAGQFSRNPVIEFDHLVLAIGTVVDLSRVPGMPEHSRVLKTVGDAIKLRTTVINRLEEANLSDDRDAQRRLLTFVIVGGGYSGVEVAGQMLGMLRAVKPAYHNLRDVPLRVVLVHSGKTLLPEVGEKLGRYAEEKLRARGMEVLLNRRVVSMTAHRVFLDEGDPIETAMVLSTVGNAPNPVVTEFAKRYNLPTEHGRLVTERTLQVKGRDRLWAAGDCAAVPAEAGKFSPPTAQFAQRQGKVMGMNIARHLAGKPLENFHHRNLGQLASIGHHTAVAEIMGMRFSGFIAWWMWRTIYLAKLPGLQRKLRVLIDWTMDLFFPREMSTLQPGPTEMMQEIHLEPGCILCNAGEPARSFYIVKAGRIDLFDGDRLKESVLAGGHFGDRTLEGNGGWPYSAMAAEPSTLVAISRETFEVLVRASNSLHNALVQDGADKRIPANGNSPIQTPAGVAR